MYIPINQTVVVVEVLRMDERSHRSYVLSTIYVSLDFNNSFLKRLSAFDILRCGPFRLSYGSPTSGMVTCAPGIPSCNFYFILYLSGVVIPKAGMCLLRVMLSCLRLLCFEWAIVIPLFVGYSL